LNDRDRARQVIAESLRSGDPTGWFEDLYAASRREGFTMPWDDGEPNEELAAWLDGRAGSGAALVVGAGPGRDAELVAARGYATTAFDVSPTAIEAARERFPSSPVTYTVADLLDPPAEWGAAFDLVVEVFTVQSLPEPPRADAIRSVAGFVAPGGTLLVVATARDDGTPDPAGPPWPLLRDEVESFADGDLELVRLERLGHRWRAELRRAV
jgi:SAM-dependent methyltransferase